MNFLAHLLLNGIHLIGLSFMIFYLFLVLHFFSFTFYTSIFPNYYYFFLAIFLVFCVFLLIFLDSKDYLAITSYIDTFTTLFVLFFTIIWFRKLILDSYIENLLQNSTFYFISGFILYYCGTLFLFLISNYIYKADINMLHSYWVINILLNLVLRTLLLVGLWKARTN